MILKQSLISRESKFGKLVVSRLIVSHVTVSRPPLMFNFNIDSTFSEEFIQLKIRSMDVDFHFEGIPIQTGIIIYQTKV